MKAWLKKIGNNPNVQALLGKLVGLYTIFVYKTCKWQMIGMDNHKKAIGLFAFWHSQIMMIPLLAKAAKMNKPLKAMVSIHRDGRLVRAFLEFLSVSSIDGSTGHGGAKAMLESVKLLKEGETIVGMCPDGPRGPAFELSKGTIAIANAAEVPLYAMTYAVKKRKILRTWDKFMIPLPFSKGVMMISEPFYLDKNPDDKRLEELRLEFQKVMNDNMKKALDIVAKM